MRLVVGMALRALRELVNSLVSGVTRRLGLKHRESS